MYVPVRFEVDDRALLVETMRRHPFATVLAVSDGDPEITHIPLLVSDDGARIEGHVARANPLGRLIESGATLTAIFHGPHTYVSPRFYRTEPNVPTWNYVVVHAAGRARIINDRGAVLAHLGRVIDAFEAGADEPWTLDRARAHAERISVGVTAFELEVQTLRGKFKLNQNRRPEDWASVVAHFDGSADAGEREMVALMRRFGPPSGSGA